MKGAPFQPLKTSYDALVACDPVSDHDRVLFPSFSSLTTILKLQKSDDIPKLPKAKVDINLTGEWTVNLEGLRFLLETTAENDMIIFATDANLRRLSACDTVYMDGTFKACPKLYSQLFTIHGLHNGYVVPLVFVLLSSKKSDAYYKLFNKLRDAIAANGEILNPKLIVTDFESGLIDAIKKQFPNALHLGCLFHYTQAVWRHVQAYGLVRSFRKEAEIGKFIKLMMALEFVPEDEVIDQAERCLNDLTQEGRQKLDEFILYFWSTWLNSMFEIKIWNKYGQDFLHRTNNRVESWHATLKDKLPLHPNIYRLINALKVQDATTRLTLAKADAGEAPAKRKPRYVTLEHDLQSLYQAHVKKQISTTELLERARHCVRRKLW